MLNAAGMSVMAKVYCLTSQPVYARLAKSSVTCHEGRPRRKKIKEGSAGGICRRWLPNMRRKGPESASGRGETVGIGQRQDGAEDINSNDATGHDDEDGRMVSKGTASLWLH